MIMNIMVIVLLLLQSIMYQGIELIGGFFDPCSIGNINTKQDG
jgi:hypothetical protein